MVSALRICSLLISLTVAISVILSMFIIDPTSCSCAYWLPKKTFTLLTGLLTVEVAIYTLLFGFLNSESTAVERRRLRIWLNRVAGFGMWTCVALLGIVVIRYQQSVWLVPAVMGIFGTAIVALFSTFSLILYAK
jgi:hypothetical protein